MARKNQFPRKSSAASDSDLERESVSAPEAAWIGALFKSAAIYLGSITAYIGVATGLVLAWKKFFAAEGEKADLTIWIVAGSLALPLLFAFVFNLLPALRRRRERDLRPTGAGYAHYFTTAPREVDPHRLFATRFEHFVEWAARPGAPLLHLTGLSGSGKSSLLSACLRPRLAAGVCGVKSTLLILRSYNDPLAALKDGLLPLCTKRPDDYDALSPLDALRRTAKQLPKDERLLVAFDQFEEFFLVRAVGPAGASSAGDDGSAPGPLLAESDVAPLRDFLHVFLDDPPEGVALLLSYRWDHQGLLSPLELPARIDKQNHMPVEGFNFATAADFIRSCPGLNVPENRMDRVLREAARQEGGRVVMRPIVANLLGLILERMASHPTLWRRNGDLLRGYVADTIGGELFEEDARILRALLTDFHTAFPRDISSLAGRSRLDPVVLAGRLESLGRAGLLRCVNASETDPARRTWQIAHDFLATLIERVLDGVHLAFWRNLRPWLTPAAVVLAFGVGFTRPWVENMQAVGVLSNEGIHWERASEALIADSRKSRRVEDLAPLASQIHRLKPRSLALTNCTALQNVDGLKGLTSLQSLDLGNCAALQNVDSLKGLTGLQSLNLTRCVALKNVDGLKGLTGLQNLKLNYCLTLQNVDGLKGLTALQSLELPSCSALQNVDGLKGLVTLHSLNLALCESLQNVNGLKGLIGLQNLDLNGCKALANVDGLKELPALHTLNLTWTNTLINLEALSGLAGLRSLDLHNCGALKNVDGLKSLTDLQSLNLGGCTAIPIDALHKLRSSLPNTDITFPNGKDSP